jgi:type VI secretion system protein ImpH
MRSEGWRFSFYQAVWLLGQLNEDAAPVGGLGPVSKEAIRFRPDIEMGFPATDVRRIRQHIDPVTDRTYDQIDVTFLGLYGVTTPLPLHYATRILKDEQKYEEPASANGDPQPRPKCSPVREFLDVIHHRLIALFYRSWLKYRYERSFGDGRADQLTECLLNLVGMSSSQSADNHVSPVKMIRYAGLLTQKPRSASGLQGLLGDYWSASDVDVVVEQFDGRWVAIDPLDQSQLGIRNFSLGVDLTVGSQIYDLAGAFKVIMGPLDWATYLEFLPDGSKFAQTQELIRLYASDPLVPSIELRLKAGEIPETQLTSDSFAGRLGYTSWIRTAEMDETAVSFVADDTERSHAA